MRRITFDAFQLLFHQYHIGTAALSACFGSLAALLRFGIELLAELIELFHGINQACIIRQLHITRLGTPRPAGHLPGWRRPSVPLPFTLLTLLTMLILTALFTLFPVAAAAILLLLATAGFSHFLFITRAGILTRVGFFSLALLFVCLLYTSDAADDSSVV